MLQLQLGLQCDVCEVVGLVNGSVYLICLIIIIVCPDSGSGNNITTKCPYNKKTDHSQ